MHKPRTLVAGENSYEYKIGISNQAPVADALPRSIEKSKKIFFAIQFP
jgi:hypothetical protein